MIAWIYNHIQNIKLNFNFFKIIICFKVEDTCVTILNIFRNKDYSFWVTALILKIWWFKSNVLRIIIKIWIPKLQESLYIQS